MKTYDVYAKPILNNPANESRYVQTIHAKNKKHATETVINMIENRGFYHLNSYFAVIVKPLSKQS